MRNKFVNQAPARPEPGCHPVIKILFGIFMLSVLLCWACFSVMIVASYVRKRYEYATYIKLQDSGVVTQATVIDQQVWSDEDGTSFRITYQFDTPVPAGDKKQFTRTASVKVKTYDGLTLGGPVTIIYLPGDPDISRIQSDYHPHPPELTSIYISGLVLLFMLLLMGGIGVALGRNRKLVRKAKARQDRFFGHRTETGVGEGVLRCEKCYRPLGPELLVCSDLHWPNSRLQRCSQSLSMQNCAVR